MIKQVPCKSYILWRDIIVEGEVNGRWVVVHKADSMLYPAGTMVCEPAGPDDTDDMTFTANNGKRYMDVPSGSRWRPRS
jgi:hypothetical protein